MFFPWNFSMTSWENMKTYPWGYEPGDFLYSLSDEKFMEVPWIFVERMVWMECDYHRMIYVMITLGVQRPLNKWPFRKDHYFSRDLQSTIPGDYYFNGLWLPGIIYGCFQKYGKTPKWMVKINENNGKPYWNGWFGGSIIFGNIDIIYNFIRGIIIQ